MLKIILHQEASPCIVSPETILVIHNFSTEPLKYPSIQLMEHQQQAFFLPLSFLYQYLLWFVQDNLLYDNVLYYSLQFSVTISINTVILSEIKLGRVGTLKPSDQLFRAGCSWLSHIQRGGQLYRVGAYSINPPLTRSQLPFQKLLQKLSRRQRKPGEKCVRETCGFVCILVLCE